MNVTYIYNKYNIYNYIKYVLYKPTHKYSETLYVPLYIAFIEKHFAGKEWYIEQNSLWSTPTKLPVPMSKLCKVGWGKYA